MADYEHTVNITDCFNFINNPERIKALKELNIVYTPAEERFDRITRMACQMFRIPVALISLVMQDNLLWFKSRQGITEPGIPSNEMMSMCGRSIMGNEPFIIEDTFLDPVFKNNILVTNEPYFRFYAGMPLRTDNGLKLGTLCLLDSKPHDFDLDQQDLLRDLAIWVESELKLSALMESHHELNSKIDELHRKSMIDPLTQVWNRNGMDEIVNHEISRAIRRQCNVTVMMIDIDHFKDINDRYGHQAGDSTLQEVAQRIRKSLRPHDILVRYGGDEFFIFLYDCNNKIATEVAERTRLCVFKNPIEANGLLIDTTVSIGVVTKECIQAKMIESIIQEADKALYRAKQKGRNNFEFI